MRKLELNKISAAALICGLIPLLTLPLLSLLRIHFNSEIQTRFRTQFFCSLLGLILSGIGSRNNQVRGPALGIAALLCGCWLALMGGFVLLAWVLSFLS